jgi:hypothetical protein
MLGGDPRVATFPAVIVNPVLTVAANRPGIV